MLQLGRYEIRRFRQVASAEKDYECTKATTPERVSEVIERIPAVKDRIKTDTKDFEISILLATNPKDKNT